MGDIVFRTFPHNPASLGLICNFISNHEPFDNYEFGLTVKSIRHQLRSDSNLVGTVDDNIVAYLGWIYTNIEIAEAWTNKNGPLAPIFGGEAIAVTILASESSAHLLPLMRVAKNLNLSKSVFWKREFNDGRRGTKRAVRKRAL